MRDIMSKHRDTMTQVTLALFLIGLFCVGVAMMSDTRAVIINFLILADAALGTAVFIVMQQRRVPDFIVALWIIIVCLVMPGIFALALN